MRVKFGLFQFFHIIHQVLLLMQTVLITQIDKEGTCPQAEASGNEGIVAILIHFISNIGFAVMGKSPPQLKHTQSEFCS